MSPGRPLSIRCPNGTGFGALSAELVEPRTLPACHADRPGEGEDSCYAVFRTSAGNEPLGSQAGKRQAHPRGIGARVPYQVRF